MKPVRITGKNILSFRKLDVEIPQGLVAVTGENRDAPGARSNGSGKSAIVDAFSWCCYGETTRGVTGDDVVNTAVGKGCHVATHFDNGVVITRHRKDGGAKNTLKIMNADGELIHFDRVKDAQAQIDKMLGLDWLTFRQAVLFGQDAVRFLALTDSEKKAVIERVLGTEVLDRAAGIARKQEHALGVEIEKAERDEELARTKADGLDREAKAKKDAADERRKDRKQEITRVEGEHKLATQELEENKKSHDARLKEHAAKRTPIEKALPKLQGMEQTARETWEKSSDELEELLKKTDGLETEGNLAHSKAHGLEKEAKARRESAEQRKVDRKAETARIEQELDDLGRQEMQDSELGEEEIRDLKAQVADVEKNLPKLNLAVDAARVASGEVDTSLAEAEQAEKQAEGESTTAQVRYLDLVQESDKITDQSGTCPTCRQEITAEHVKAVRAKYDKDIAAAKSKNDDAKKLRDAAVGARKTVEETRAEAGAEYTKAEQEHNTAKLRLETARRDLDRAEQEQTRRAGERENTRVKLEGRLKDIPTTDSDHDLKEADRLEAEAKKENAKATAAAKEQEVLLAKAEEDIKQVEAFKEAHAVTKQEREQQEANLAAVKSAEEATKSARAAAVDAREKALQTLTLRLGELRKPLPDSDCQEVERIALEANSERSKVTEAQKVAKAAKVARFAATFWAEGFGLRGLRSMLLDGVLPFIEERANGYLQELTGGVFRLGLSPVAEKKSGKKGELRDAVAVGLSSSSGAEVYAGLSGGERQRVDVAVALALFDLARSRTGTDLGLVVFDEVFERLDDAGCEAVGALLRKNAPRWGTALLVTHLDGLLAEVPRRVRVLKEGGESKVIGGTNGKE